MKLSFVKPLIVGSLALTSTFYLTGCGGGSSSSSSTPTDSTAAYTLQLLHAADMDGATGALDNVKHFSAILSALADDYNNTLILSSGDNYIPGPRYAAAEDDSLAAVNGVMVPGVGRGDIAFLNAMGFQASAVGNHDLDGGTEEFVDIISPDGDYPGASFPYLSSNLDFSTDANTAALVTANGQAASNIAGKLAGTATIDVNGETIGIVAATTPKLATITSTGGITISPNNSDDVVELATSIQPNIDALTASGINKIILLAHMQTISTEQALAPLLNDVDIIVAGGSNTLLADSNDRLMNGDTAAGTYPLMYTNASGDPVAIVNVDGDYKYLGRLVVGFDENGVLLESSIDDTISGAYVSDDDMVAQVGGMVNTNVEAIADALSAVLAERDGNIMGKTSVFLDGRRSQVRTQETNLGNLSADANLWYAQQVDPSVQISIKNGGGIRDDIGYTTYPPGSTGSDDLVFMPPAVNESIGKEEGDVSQFDIQGALRFNNGLALLTLTAQEVYDVIEHGVAAVENVAGQFPQVSGLRFSYDPQGTAIIVDENTGAVTTPGTRVKNLAVVNSDGNVVDTIVQDGVLQGDASRTFRIVTLDFMAGKYTGDGYEGPVGGDSYPWGYPLTNLVELSDTGLADGEATFADAGSEQDAIAEYLKAFHPSATPYSAAETDTDGDMRIQNLSVRGDTVFQGRSLVRLGAYNTSIEGGSEIVSYDSVTERMFTTNGENNAIDIIDISDPSSPTLVRSIDLSSYGEGVNSVAVKNSLVAVACEGDDQAKGSVVFFDTDGTFIRQAEVGFLPDMVTFNEDGSKVIVANEGEPNDDYDNDPVGSIGVVTVADGSYVDIGFDGVTLSNANDGTAVRLGGTPSNDQAKDIEPEYITVSNGFAYVTLQENNALAKVDLSDNSLSFVKSFGAKSYGTGQSTIDIEENGVIELKNFDGLFGLYQPDSIASYVSGGSTYLVTANEGDGREYIGNSNEFLDEEKIKDMTLDASIAANFANDNDLKVMMDLGDADNDGVYEELYTYGARSFSIWDANGDLVWDSGDDIAKKVAEVEPMLFNKDEDEMDGRSGNKGVEPEALTVGIFDGKTYAFIGLERQDAIIVYDITDPIAPVFVDYMMAAVDGDISPEGMTFVPAADSPNGKNLLLVSYEVSGSTVIYEVK